MVLVVGLITLEISYVPHYDTYTGRGRVPPEDKWWDEEIGIPYLDWVDEGYNLHHLPRLTKDLIWFTISDRSVRM